ncbi:MAG TPA: hypothetical protein VFL98_00005, partial [Candidatus Paceibacterota bacterium]|nr:hypothetical protein [Candidatus Paceibacterota bacterium]
TCSGCTSQTFSYSNGNGTYSTITTFSQSNISGSGNHGGTPPGGGVGTPVNNGPGGPSGCPAGKSWCTTSCPAGYILSGNACVPPPPSCPSGYTLSNGACVPSNGGGTMPPSCPSGDTYTNGVCQPPVSGCPSGYTLYNNQCYANSQCTTTSSGKGGSSTSCSGSPIPMQYQPIMSAQPSQQGPFVPPIISIIAVPAIVHNGGTSLLTWDGGTSDSCTVTGPDFSRNGISASGVPIDDITEQRLYTLTCYKGGNSYTAKATVNILPIWQEI